LKGGGCKGDIKVLITAGVSNFPREKKGGVISLGLSTKNIGKYKR
jgi:hypothetical protein